MRKGLRPASRLLLFSLLITESVVWADAPAWKLSIKPQKCVALRQGNVCYQDVTVDWQTPEKGNYCLYSKHEKRAIKCWHDTSSGTLEIEFQSKSSQSYLLRKNGDNKDLMTTTIEVKWVYRNKHNTRTGWRVF